MSYLHVGKYNLCYDTKQRASEFCFSGTIPNNFETIPVFGRGYWLPYNGDWITIKGCVANRKGVAVPGKYGNVKASHRTGGWTQFPDTDEIFGMKYSEEEKVNDDGTYSVTVYGLPAPEGKIKLPGSVYTSTFDIDTVKVWRVDSPSYEATANFFHGADAY